MIHPNSTLNHKIENWTYADATARGAATGFVAADAGKIAYQTSDGTYWRLVTHSPITWAQVGSAGGGGGDVIKLASVTLAVDTNYMEFTSISGSYTHLSVMLLARSNYASADFDDMYCNINTDATNANYRHGGGYLGTAGVGALSASSRIVATAGTTISGTNEATSAVIEFPFYSDTTFNKTWLGRCFNPRSGSQYTLFYSGRWNNTAAITALRFLPVLGTQWKAGSRAILYGIN